MEHLHEMYTALFMRSYYIRIVRKNKHTIFMATLNTGGWVKNAFNFIQRKVCSILFFIFLFIIIIYEVLKK